MSPGVREVRVTPEYVRVTKRPAERGLVKVIISEGAGNVISSIITDQKAVATILSEQLVG